MHPGEIFEPLENNIYIYDFLFMINSYYNHAYLIRFYTCVSGI